MTGPSGALGMVAADLAANDPDFAVVTSDLCFFSGLERMREQSPDQLFNVGIAEQNMVNVAAGMTKEGMTVFATTYATFAATRVLDQVRVSMGYMGLPVNLIGLTSGYAVGILGATHMSIEDIAALRAIPQMLILSPADCTETVKCLYAAAASASPTYIRLCGGQRTPIVYNEDYDFEVGKAITLREGEDVLLYATGTMVHEALKTAELLQEKGVSAKVVDMHTIKPIDETFIKSNLDARLIVSMEEHSTIGGLGSAIAEVLTMEEKKPRHLVIGMPDHYPHAAGYAYLMKAAGLTAESACERILKSL